MGHPKNINAFTDKRIKMSWYCILLLSDCKPDRTQMTLYMKSDTYSINIYQLSAGNKLSTSSTKSSRCACTSCCLTASRYRSDSLCLLSSTAICHSTPVNITRISTSSATESELSKISLLQSTKAFRAYWWTSR